MRLRWILFENGLGADISFCPLRGMPSAVQLCVCMCHNINCKPCARLQALQAAAPQLEQQIGGLVDVSMGDAETGKLEAWADWNCISENCESWAVLGPWIEENKPKFGPNIIERFLWSKDVTPDKVHARVARSRS